MPSALTRTARNIYSNTLQSEHCTVRVKGDSRSFIDSESRAFFREDLPGQYIEAYPVFDLQFSDMFNRARENGLGALKDPRWCLFINMQRYSFTYDPYDDAPLPQTGGPPVLVPPQKGLLFLTRDVAKEDVLRLTRQWNTGRTPEQFLYAVEQADASHWMDGHAGMLEYLKGTVDSREYYTDLTFSRGLNRDGGPL